MSRFLMQTDVRTDAFDWGNVGWRCIPPLSGSTQLVVLDVTLEPGFGHDFHKHVDQEEVLIVRSGQIEQWVDREHRELGPGDSVYVARGTVHGSFNVGAETAELQVVLGPAVGDGGYELVDVAADEPWKSLRR